MNTGEERSEQRMELFIEFHQAKTQRERELLIKNATPRNYPQSPKGKYKSPNALEVRKKGILHKKHLLEAAESRKEEIKVKKTELRERRKTLG